jgi:phage antirepressor YoqD-like protein
VINSLNTSSTKYLKVLKTREKRFIYREKKNEKTKGQKGLDFRLTKVEEKENSTTINGPTRIIKIVYY